MKISNDTYLLMQAQLLSAMAPHVDGFVNQVYIKEHIDKMLKENDCTVVDVHEQEVICVGEISVPEFRL